MLPALAQSGPDYRALVCVFLFGGNDSNNTIIPMDDANFSAYQSIRGSLALTGAELTPVTSVSGAPYAFPFQACRSLASLFSSKELAVVANTGSLVQPLTRAQYQKQQAAIPLNLFSHSDQQVAWQTSIAQGHSATGWAGRAADYIASQTSEFFRLSRPSFRWPGTRLRGRASQLSRSRWRPGQSLQLAGFNSSRGVAGAPRTRSTVC